MAMLLRYTLALLPLLLSPYTLAQSFEWQYTAGPTAPIDQFQLYPDGSVLGISDSLLYRSGDDGLSWQQVAIAPAGLSELYVDGARLWGLADGQVLTAARLSQAWEVRSPDRRVDYLAVRGDSVFATVRSEPDRIYRSFDAGRTWEAVTHEVPDRYTWESREVQLLPSGLLVRRWMEYDFESFLFWSDDGGATWVEGTCGPFLALDPGGQTGYTATPPSYSRDLNTWFVGALLRTEDGGKTCESVRNGYFFGLTCLRDGTLLIGEYRRLAHAIDPTGDWETVELENRGVPGSGIELPSGTVLVPTRSFSLGIFDASIMSGAYRLGPDLQQARLTGPGGRAWTLAVADRKLYAGADGGLLRLEGEVSEPLSADQGWAFVGANESRIGGLYLDADTLLVFADNDEGYGFGVYRMDEGNATPTFLGNSWGQVVSDILRTDAGTLIVATTTSEPPILNVGQAGSNQVAWLPVGLYRVPSLDADFYLSKETQVYRVGVLHVDALTQTLYAGCSRNVSALPWTTTLCSGALVSSDDGNTWVKIAGGLPAADDLTEVFAFTTMFSGSVIAATRNGVYELDGTAWSFQGLSSTWVYSLHTHPTAGTLAGTERGVFRWDADTETWQPLGLGLEERTVYDVLATDDLIDGEIVLVAATDRGVYTSTPLVSIDAEDEAVPAEAFAVAAYPNPFADALTVEVALPEATEVRATVYDVLGRVVAEVPARTLSAGAHRLRLATEGLATGVYHVRVQPAGQLERVVTVTRVH
ncbi:MAG: T9SS type A sorting domain-containing protein [Bacteroidota bacterium]